MSFMSGIDITQFKYDIVTPTLVTLVGFNPALNSPAAVNLITGTALVESGLVYLEQLGSGPALGVCQMEPATHDSLWANYINYHPTLASILETIAGSAKPSSELLVTNLAYSVAMARIKYWDSVYAMPEATDAVGLANMHKTVYNSADGAASVAINTPKFQEAIQA
jgi:hypothetical protein